MRIKFRCWIRKRWLVLILFALNAFPPGPTVLAAVRVVKSSDGWRLLVDGQPFYVKGVCYSPTKVGESPDEGTWRDWMTADDDQDGRIDAPYQSWVDANRNNRKDAKEVEVGDFRLLKDMGCNAIRVYHHATASADVQEINRTGGAADLLFNHPPNKTLLRDLFKTYGIRVAMGDFLGAYAVGSGASWQEGTDYLDPAQKENMLKSVEDMVREFKDEPYILMWVLGNENNYEEFTHTNAAKHPKEYAEFVNAVAQRIKELDPTHPVCLSNGDVQLLYAYAKYTPDVDILGLNAYRGPGFGGLWEQVARTYDKPIMFTEFGAAQALKIKNDVLDEDDQARIHRGAYCDMWRHRAGGVSPGNSIGGFVFEWLDQWWHNQDPWVHNPGPKGWHGEWNGLMSQGDGKQSPLLRQPRKVYFLYQSLWTSEGDLCGDK